MSRRLHAERHVGGEHSRSAKGGKEKAKQGGEARRLDVAVGRGIHGPHHRRPQTGPPKGILELGLHWEVAGECWRPQRGSDYEKTGAWAAHLRESPPSPSSPPPPLPLHSHQAVIVGGGVAGG